MRRIVFAFLLVLVAFERPAQAFVDPPVLVPQHPFAGQPVSVSIREGMCDSLAAYPPPTLTHDGKNIHLVIQSWSTTDLEFCTSPILTDVFPIGSFAAGSYAVQVDRIYPSGNGPVTETLGVLPFTVSNPASVPTLSTAGAIGLGMMLMILALLFGRRRAL